MPKTIFRRVLKGREHPLSNGLTWVQGRIFLYISEWVKARKVDVTVDLKPDLYKFRIR